MLSDMQKKFHELTKQAEAHHAAIKPVAEQYDALRKQQFAIDEQLKPLVAKLKELRAPLFSLDNERAAISRALQGKTGKPE